MTSFPQVLLPEFFYEFVLSRIRNIRSVYFIFLDLTILVTSAAVYSTHLEAIRYAIFSNIPLLPHS